MNQDLVQDSSMALAIYETLRFILEALLDWNPVTGHAELDELKFPEILTIFRQLTVDDVTRPSDSSVRQAWGEVLAEVNVKMRYRKSVSKCDRCLELRTRIRKVS